jgi:hypothetical protein
MIFSEPQRVMRSTTKIALLLLALALIFGVFVRPSPEFIKGTDFPDFYAAAKMVREGAGGQLYSISAQRMFQARYTGRAGTYFIHPSFEALVYLPFCLVSLPRAYLFWNLLSVVLLMAVAYLVRHEVLRELEWPLLTAIAFSFVPVLLNLQQGQDSLLLLFLLTCSFVALERERSFAAGCLLAGGLFKFQLILPLALVILVGRNKKCFAGFSLVTTVAVLLSVAVSGWSFVVDYPRFLAGLGVSKITGVHPQIMANARGLLSLVLPRDGRWNLSVISAVSLILLIIAMAGWWLAGEAPRPLRNLAFANAVLAALLSAYHLSPHDLSLMLLPLALVVQYLWTARGTFKTLEFLLALDVAALFVPPLHLYLILHQHYAYMAIPILFLFILIFLEIWRFHQANLDKEIYEIGAPRPATPRT